MNWLDRALRGERFIHGPFFGQTFDLSLLADVLASYGENKVEEWRKLGLEVHFLPSIRFTRETNLSGWQVKPGKWYWAIEMGDLLRRNNAGELQVMSESHLNGIVALIDVRPRPEFVGIGEQMFQDDRCYLGPILRQLRNDRVIEPYERGPQDSRFGVSSEEWDEHVRFALARQLGFEPKQIRLETVLEANIIPQLYLGTPRRTDGHVRTWTLNEEYWLSSNNRVHGGYGHNDYDRLCNVSLGNSQSHWCSGAIRPLTVLAN